MFIFLLKNLFFYEKFTLANTLFNYRNRVISINLIIGGEVSCNLSDYSAQSFQVVFNIVFIIFLKCGVMEC